MFSVSTIKYTVLYPMDAYWSFLELAINVKVGAFICACAVSSIYKCP